MKSGVANATKLGSLLKKLGKPDPVPSAGEGDTGYDDPIAVIVFSFMLWESTTKQAQDAMRKIVDSVVDFNELRVSLPGEVAAIIGTRYPNAMQRAQQLKTALHDIYLAHHAVSLEPLQSAGKREVRAFIEGLKGMPPYVAARVLQRCYDVHAIPVDDRLVDLLIGKGVLTEIAPAEDVSKWLSRQVKSSDGTRVEAALRAFVDDSPRPTPRRQPAKAKSVDAPKPAAEASASSDVAETTGKAAARKTAKKPATKKPATKKAATKKTAKKPVAKKTTTKKATTKKTVKKPATKKAAAKKKVTKKAPAKKSVTKKKVAKKAAKKTAKKTAKKATKKTRKSAR